MTPDRQNPDAAKVPREHFLEGKTVRPWGLRAFLLFCEIVVGVYSLGHWLTDVAKLISHL